MHQRTWPKVFGLGLNKTGTTTLGQCGRILGLRCTSAERSLLEDVVLRNDFTRIKQRVSAFDLFEDWPWPLIYRQLDEMYPGSKFVLTVRKSPDAWLESLKKHSMKTSPLGHHRKLAYGFNYPHGHEQEHLDFYNKHNDNVRSYFRNRSNDFIEVCWETGDGFESLCRLLDCDLPAVPLPHANRWTDNRPKLPRVVANRILRCITS